MIQEQRYAWDGVRWVPGITGAAIVSPTAPLNPTSGTMWWNPDNKVMSVWDGSAWSVVAGLDVPGGVFEGDLTIVGNLIATIDCGVY